MEWIKKIEDHLHKTLIGKPNNAKTRLQVAQEVRDILYKENIDFLSVDATSFNTQEVINNGAFYLKVSTSSIDYIFKVY